MVERVPDPQQRPGSAEQRADSAEAAAIARADTRRGVSAAAEQARRRAQAMARLEIELRGVRSEALSDHDERP